MTFEEAKNKIGVKVVHSCLTCVNWGGSKERRAVYCCAVLSGLVGEEIATSDTCCCDEWKYFKEA